MRLLPLVLILVAAPLVAADPLPTTITGTATKVIDGDTLWITDGDGIKTKIRLAEIDAPEKNQPWYNESRKALADLVEDKEVLIKSTGKDKYGRTLGTVYVRSMGVSPCEPLPASINLQMVRNGDARHFKKYSQDKALAEAEKEARKDKRGLWQSPTKPHRP